jgi:hypothetical protein
MIIFFVAHIKKGALPSRRRGICKNIVCRTIILLRHTLLKSTQATYFYQASVCVHYFVPMYICGVLFIFIVSTFPSCVALFFGVFFHIVIFLFAKSGIFAASRLFQAFSTLLPPFLLECARLISLAPGSPKGNCTRIK